MRAVSFLTARRAVFVATLLVLLSACSGGAKLPGGIAAPALPGSQAAGSAAVASQSRAVAAVAMPASQAARSGAPSSQTGTAVQLPTALGIPSMVIRNATITIETTNPSQAQQALGGIAQDFQGQVLNSRTTYQGSRLFIVETIEVPSAQFIDALNRVRGLGKVTNENTSSQDVTQEYVDVQSQLANLRVSEARLQALMARAKNVQDVIAVERELAGVQGQLDQVEGREKYLQTKSAMSSIQATFQLPPPASALPTVASWQPSATLVEALSAVARFWQGMVDLVIWLVVFLGPPAALAMIAWAVWVRRPRQTPTASPVPPVGSAAPPAP